MESGQRHPHVLTSRSLFLHLVAWNVVLASARLFVCGFFPFEGSTTAQSRRPTRVVTDIDDTVKSSGNLRLAGIPLGGIDAQYGRGDFYPGVCQFALELARSGKGRKPYRPLEVAVLTARAEEFLFALELDAAHPVTQRYRLCGEENREDGWGLGPVLYGSVLEWICQERKGWRKYDNFLKLVDRDEKESRSASREAPRYIFIGDTGEGDTWAACQMCGTHPDSMIAVFLHVVSEKDEYEVPDDLSINGIPILFFRTYVGAARKAFKRKLLNRPSLNRIIACASRELEALDTCYDSSRWLDLRVDIAEAKREMRASAWLSYF